MNDIMLTNEDYKNEMQILKKLPIHSFVSIY